MGYAIGVIGVTQLFIKISISLPDAYCPLFLLS